MQIVWVPLSLLEKVAQIAEKLHLPINQTIIVLVFYALREERTQQSNNGTLRFTCPICLQEFNDANDLLMHLKGDEDIAVKPHI